MKKKEDFSKKKILLIEDEKDVAELYQEILDKHEMKLDLALSGKDGLKKMEEKKYDLILLDLMMPEIDGLQVLERVKKDPKKYGSMPVVVLTNLVSDTVMKDAHKKGADGYLVKTDFDIDTFAEEVRIWLRKDVRKDLSR